MTVPTGFTSEEMAHICAILLIRGSKMAHIESAKEKQPSGRRVLVRVNEVIALRSDLKASGFDE
jgi:hypothetical protein